MSRPASLRVVDESVVLTEYDHLRQLFRASIALDAKKTGHPHVRLAVVREYDNLERVLLDTAAYVALDPTAGEGEV